MDFMIHEFIEEQIESIDQLNRLIAQLSAMDNGLGEYTMDKYLAEL